MSIPVANLRIEVAGFPINDYRIVDRSLEMRVLDSNGQAFKDSRSTWRRLTTDELLLHFRFATLVSRWFSERMAACDADAWLERKRADAA